MQQASQPESGHRRSTYFVLGVAALARLIAIALVLTRYPKGWLFTRGMEMTLLAQNVLTGHGLSSPFGGHTGPSAFIAPGYPLLVAAVFKLFGIETTASAFVIMLLQATANVLTVAVLMHLARTLFNHRAALIAGLIWALSPPLILLPTIFWDTSFAALLLTTLVVLVLRYQDQSRPPSLRAWLFLGAYCALTALLTSALFLVVLLIPAWLAWRTRKSSLLHPVLALLVFVLVYSPWPIRNERVFHAFIPLRTTVGVELWMGNHEGAKGYLIESVLPLFSQSEMQQYTQLGEIAYTNQKSLLARQYIAAHPAAFTQLTARRILRFWTGTGTQNGSPFFALYGTLISVLGLIGLWLIWRRGQSALAALFALPLFFFPIPYYITHAEFRYRLLLDPLLTVLAAYTVTRLFTEPAGLQKSSQQTKLPS